MTNILVCQVALQSREGWERRQQSEAQTLLWHQLLLQLSSQCNRERGRGEGEERERGRAQGEHSTIHTHHMNTPSVSPKGGRGGGGSSTSLFTVFMQHRIAI